MLYLPFPAVRWNILAMSSYINWEISDNVHNAFAPGREAANPQSIENLTTTPLPLQATWL
jgi:VanZ family protein